MALVMFLQEDEDVPSVYCNLKIVCETAPGICRVPVEAGKNERLMMKG